MESGLVADALVFLMTAAAFLVVVACCAGAFSTEDVAEVASVVVATVASIADDTCDDGLGATDGLGAKYAPTAITVTATSRARGSLCIIMDVLRPRCGMGESATVTKLVHSLSTAGPDSRSPWRQRSVFRFPRMLSMRGPRCGMGESNPQLKFGKLAFYH